MNILFIIFLIITLIYSIGIIIFFDKYDEEFYKGE